MKNRLLGLASAAAIVTAALTVNFGPSSAQGGAAGGGAAAPAQRGGGGAGGGAGAGGGQRGGGGGQRGGGGGAGAGGGGQRGGGGGGGGTIPRGIDGKPLLSPGANGQIGLWHGAFQIGATNIPYQPWARAMQAQRIKDNLEPHARCKPSGAVRQFQTPYGVDIIEMPELKRVYFFDVGGPHTYKIIYTDGRPHPKDLTPSYYGHSVGSWDGDTFVVDTVGYNERFWLDRSDNANEGFPHTEQLHTIERYTRTSATQIQYTLTVDDPGAYTATWTTNTYNIELRSNEQLFEYICQDNNQGGELMVGTMSSVSRKTTIVP